MQISAILVLPYGSPQNVINQVRGEFLVIANISNTCCSSLTPRSTLVSGPLQQGQSQSTNWPVRVLLLRDTLTPGQGKSLVQTDQRTKKYENAATLVCIHGTHVCYKIAILRFVMNGIYSFTLLIFRDVWVREKERLLLSKAEEVGSLLYALCPSQLLLQSTRWNPTTPRNGHQNPSRTSTTKPARTSTTSPPPLRCKFVVFFICDTPVIIYFPKVFLDKTPPSVFC